MNLRAFNWYMQRVTGALLLVLLVMHFWVEHFAADVRATELSYELVQQRFFRNPWFLYVDVAFLLLALYHGLYGLRNILFDYAAFSRPAVRRATVAALWGVGLLWAYWGIGAFSDSAFFHPAGPAANVGGAGGSPGVVKQHEVDLATVR